MPLVTPVKKSFRKRSKSEKAAMRAAEKRLGLPAMNFVGWDDLTDGDPWTARQMRVWAAEVFAVEPTLLVDQEMKRVWQAWASDPNHAVHTAIYYLRCDLGSISMQATEEALRQSKDVWLDAVLSGGGTWAFHSVIEAASSAHSWTRAELVPLIASPDPELRMLGLQLLTKAKQ